MALDGTEVRTRQEVRQQNAAPTDEERHLRNAEANREALEKIYDFYYESDGSRKPDASRLRQLYRLMSTETTEYLNEAVDDEDLERLENIPGATVRGQRVSNQERAMAEYEEDIAAYRADLDDYEAELDDYDRRVEEYEARPAPRGRAPVPPEEPEEPERPEGPEDNYESLVNGDYFHVINNNFSVRRSQRQERARRLVINVRTQDAALRVAHSLGDLFRENGVSPYLHEFKVYLSSTPDDTRKVKYDKIVVYYVTADDGDDDDGTDRIGDRLVDTIQSVVTEEDVVDRFAPFYSSVGPGVAWAEEPKYYIDALKNSFTKTRSNIIAKVIKESPHVPDKDTFVSWVASAMVAAQIDPVDPHRHVPPPPGPPPPDTDEEEEADDAEEGDDEASEPDGALAS
ncbi:T3SS effector HopA1 family protein [Actinomadura sp. WMMB 499]|uniref:T3SS effector HopA1 family protein n=1 Tax=Actinomadura sp. WMMB 499 TaxID=1219491 RepID=UPI00124656D7|nr:T3SS effector HopA1 family protein [Actinomadura sp. WMMB 499]QFG22231.1 hypothetical protein F7P10_14935 [Actinomadura sp. WMMB 499]